VVGAAGRALTVIAEVELLQPVPVCVKVKVALPAATPITIPALVTVATAGLLLAQVPPLVGDSVIVLPTHTMVLAVVTVGLGFTVTVMV
jgi:hypothetical protein